jgi:hypothetical protein
MKKPNKNLYIFTTNKVLRKEQDHLFCKNNTTPFSILQNMNDSNILNLYLPEIDNLGSSISHFNFESIHNEIKEVLSDEIKNMDELVTKINLVNSFEKKIKIQKLIATLSIEEKYKIIYKLKSENNVFAYYIKNYRCNILNEFDALLMDCISIYNLNCDKKNDLEDFEKIHFIVHDKDIFGKDVTDRVLNNFELTEIFENNKIIRGLFEKGKINYYTFMHEDNYPVNNFLLSLKYSEIELVRLLENLNDVPLFNEIECLFNKTIFKNGKERIPDDQQKIIGSIISKLSLVQKDELMNSLNSNVQEFKKMLDKSYTENNIKLSLL